MHHDTSSLARIVRWPFHLRWPRSENVEAVQTRARYEMVRLERGLVVLEVIVGIAPLIGLIGTVSGLIHVFESLVERGRGRCEEDRLGHFGSAERHHFRSGHRGRDPDRVCLFFEKGGSVLGRDGIARDRFAFKMLLRPRGRGNSCDAADRARARAGRSVIRGMKFAVRKKRAPRSLLFRWSTFWSSCSFSSSSRPRLKRSAEVQINLPESKTARTSPRNRSTLVSTIDLDDEIKLDGKIVDPEAGAGGAGFAADAQVLARVAGRQEGLVRRHYQSDGRA